MKKILFIIIITSYMIPSNKINKDTRYSYNDNGRIIIPDNEVIKLLPEDGGELWNRLIFESSPYLLQHAANPVEWYPWSKEAFDLAKSLNKPVFLSIGYTTCHWCHVMEHESFEDDEVATLMNDAFVNIKVDREERPDIDNIYMEVTQQLTGRGGWPMTVIMTPDKKPFFAGTYFPKKSRPQYKRIGMLELIPSVKDAWINKQDSLLTSADNIVDNIAKSNFNRTNQKVKLKENILNSSFNVFYSRFDKEFGGFTRTRNKFPKPHDYSFIAKHYFHSKDEQALELLNKSLYSIKNGGIFDQIGFGIHRYSTDKKWLVPHFEKMLYDQALIIHAYLDAYLQTNDIFYKTTVEQIINYVLNNMTDPSGGFYSAEDADSEGEEGVFYIWKSSELKNILDDDEYIFISDVLNISDNGNCNVEGQRTNIPHFTKDWDELFSKHQNLKFSDKNQLIDYYHTLREKIYLEREKRVHPQKDDKILTDWNGLMISALSRAGVILDNDDYIAAAKKSADFIIENLITNEGVLLKRHRNGISGIDGMIEDYAFFIWALIELYQANFDTKYIKVATDLSDYQINHFWDFENNGFYFTSDKSEELFVRSKEIYDGAIPSGNSVAAYNFIRLSKILSRTDYEDIAYKIVDAFAYNLNRSGTYSSMLLQAITLMEKPFYEVIIVGDADKSSELIRFIQQHPQPNKIIIYSNGIENDNMFEFLDFYKSKNNGEPLVYVCQNYSCKLPTDDVKILDELLR